jgi:hypothetical protein
MSATAIAEPIARKNAGNFAHTGQKPGTLQNPRTDTGRTVMGGLRGDAGMSVLSRELGYEGTRAFIWQVE